MKNNYQLLAACIIGLALAFVGLGFLIAYIAGLALGTAIERQAWIDFKSRIVDK